MTTIDPRPSDQVSFASLLRTIGHLSDQALARGDRKSASILFNVGALLAEVQTGSREHQSADRSQPQPNVTD